jgi:Tfp pilus assembly protein PilV
MINNNIKINRKLKINKIKGFTLVETLVAVFILTFSIVILMKVVSDGLFSARYARNEITAIYLAQEALEYIRNDRDSLLFEFNNKNQDYWEVFENKYKDCFNPSGCSFDVLDMMTGDEASVSACEDNECPYFYYHKNKKNFYSYDIEEGVKSNFQRKIMMEEFKEDVFVLEVKVLWKENSFIKETIVKTILTKWQ